MPKTKLATILGNSTQFGLFRNMISITSPIPFFCEIFWHFFKQIDLVVNFNIFFYAWALSRVLKLQNSVEKNLTLIHFLKDSVIQCSFCSYIEHWKEFQRCIYKTNLRCNALFAHKPHVERSVWSTNKRWFL